MVGMLPVRWKNPKKQPILFLEPHWMLFFSVRLWPRSKRTEIPQQAHVMKVFLSKIGPYFSYYLVPHHTLFSLRGPKIIDRLYIIYRLVRKYFFHMKRSSISVMGCTIFAFAPSLWLLKREGSFSYHTCYNMWPRSLQSYIKAISHQRALYATLQHLC